MSNGFIIENSGSVRIIRFSRPEIRSPLSIAVLEGLHAEVDAVGNNAAVSGLIFTGVDNVFASGADLREVAAVTGGSAREFALRGQSLTTKIALLRCETIAAVNGYCFGGALDLALACKLRIAEPTGLFSHPGTGLGIITGWGGTQRLPRLIGGAAAVEMFFTGRRMTAQEAFELGLVDRIADDALVTATQIILNG